jgi:hypothetical protein
VFKWRWLNVRCVEHAPEVVVCAAPEARDMKFAKRVDEITWNFGIFE